MRRDRTGWFALAVILLLASPICAKEEPELFPVAYATQRAAFLATEAKKEVELLPDAIEALVTAALKFKRPEIAKDARKLLKKHLRYTKKREKVTTATARYYGILQVKGSSRDLRPLAEEKKSKKVPTTIRAYALYSIARIADPKTHDLILDYLDSPKPDKTARSMAVVAAKAIGLYAPLDAKRKFAIMKDVMKKWADLHGAARGTIYVSADALEWWNVTLRPMVASFNQVLGLQFVTYSRCEEWWRDNRRKVQKGKW